MKNSIPANPIKLTVGNYDEFGNLIKTEIPTITTDLCEIGIFSNTLYFVVIVLSKTLKKTAFDTLTKNFENAKLYGFINFKKTLYPIPNFAYKKFKKETSSDEYLQIEFDYEYKKLSPRESLDEYQKVKLLLSKSKLVAIDQTSGTLNKKNN